MRSAFFRTKGDRPPHRPETNGAPLMKNIRVLNLERTAAASTSLRRALETDFDLDWRRVGEESDFRNALAEQNWDIVISSGPRKQPPALSELSVWRGARHPLGSWKHFQRSVENMDPISEAQRDISGRLRAFIEFFAARFGERPPWEHPARGGRAVPSSSKEGPP